MKVDSKQKIIKRLYGFFSLSAGFLIFYFFLHFSGWDRIRQLGKLELLPLIFISIFTIGITSSVSYRWGGLVNAIGGKQVAKWYQYYHYFLISRVVGFILPKDVSDFLGRAGFVNRVHSLTVGKSGVSVLLDRLFDLVTTLIFFCAALPFWMGFVDLNQGIVLMVSLAFIIYLGIFLYYDFLFRCLSRISSKGMKFIHSFPFLKKINLSQEDVDFLNRKIISVSLLLSILKFCLTAFRFVLIAMALQISIPASLIVLGTPLGQLAYIVAITPGALGIFEAGWFGILCLGGVSPGEASLFVVGQRILILICILFIFMIAQMIFYYISKKTT